MFFIKCIVSQRGNQGGLHLAYHQYATTHEILPQAVDASSGMQMAGTPLQLPGTTGQPITLTRTNEGKIRLLISK